MGIAEKTLMEFHALRQHNLPIKTPAIAIIYGAFLAAVLIFVAACIIYNV